MNPPRGKEFFARRVDKNQPEIMQALQAAGYRCWSTHRAGFGIPDVLALSKTNIPVLLEIKMPGEKLTDAETKFHFVYDAPIAIVDSIEAAIKTMQQYDKLCLTQEVKPYWKVERGINKDRRNIPE